PGARFVLETGAAAECLLPSLHDRRFWQAGDMFMLVANRYDAAEGRLDTEYTFLRGGETQVRSSCQYVYTAAEIARLFRAAGLDVRERYGSPARVPFELGCPRLILVAQKRPC